MTVSRMNARSTTNKPKRMTTPFKEFSPYENGRIRNLKFDVNALADFEQEVGMGFAQLMRMRAIFGSARAMLWAGLKHEDRGLRIEDVGELMTEYLSDQAVPKGEHNIDALLMVAIDAAVKQGALGNIVNQADEPAEGDDAAALPPGVVSPNDAPGSDQTS